MLPLVLAVGLGFMILERMVPDQKLPRVSGWWQRVLLLNVLQFGVVLLGGMTYDRWFQEFRIFHLSGRFSAPAAGFLSYLALTLVYYWWHRLRHTSEFLWSRFHQLHHSPARIETITSFYKHPGEILANGIIIGSITYCLFGLSIEAGGWVTFYSALGEFIYHMNIRTPRWMGYFFQRPEMHRIHHERGRHFNNFSDLPVWDMIFGTYRNPETYQGPCGFRDDRELRFWDMLKFKNVNSPYRRPGASG